MRLHRRLGNVNTTLKRQIKAILEKRSATVRHFVLFQAALTHAVAAVLVSKAIGKQLTCVFVDHGLMRKNEGDEVEACIWS